MTSVVVKDLELWAGVECTVVQIGRRFVDEIERTGHARRIDDLDRLHALGIGTLRYPVLWERTAPQGLEAADWSWADARLARLRELGIRPIVGLVHHGSGPRDTSLLDPAFPAGLAAFARAVAERYPWLTDFTPINEAITTARFSALYGHWYPHARSAQAFARAVLVEAEAVRLAMRAIREVIPGARLVHTEDMGTTFSTPRLAHQALFDNERRFLALDLLTGRVDREHILRRHLIEMGATDAELDAFVAEPCPPDTIGLNYYVTSDRWLDEDVEHYPRHYHGGNERERYADVEAVRVRPAGILGHRALLDLVWQRYGLPIALTEVHLGGPSEDQIRWLFEAWEAAAAARAAGSDIRGVTIWSAFGSEDWDSLLVEDRHHYEPGLFDSRQGIVRPTALVRVARDLALNGKTDHPVLADVGWWHKPSRILHGPMPGRAASVLTRAPSPRVPPILVTGASGTLGRALLRVCEERGLRAIGLGRAACDVTDRSAVERAIATLEPWAIVNAAGYVRVDAAEHDIDRCWLENATGARVLAEVCERAGLRLLTFSSDLVFDGTKRTPYVEEDLVAPISVYGRSKALAEELVAAGLKHALVVRTSAFFGPWDEANFLFRTLAALARGETVLAPADAIVSPTYLPDLAHAALRLLVDDASGIWHLANPGEISWVDLAVAGARAAGVDSARLRPCTIAELGLAAPRPAYSALASERGALLPPLVDAIERFAAEYRRTGVAA
jgi:dTDP-4-dehydrorhamnose reductase